MRWTPTTSLEDAVPSDLIAVALCLVGSGFFSASETALTSLPITRLEALRERSGRLTSAGLDRWASDPQSVLITILIGNNLVNVLASALATRLAYTLTGEGGLALVVGVMTLALLVFGEITPKTLAHTYAQAISVRVVPVLYVLDLVLTPVNWVLGLLSRLLTTRAVEDVPVTEEDLLFMLRLAHQHATLPSEARLMIESVLRFHQAVAREVMVPRPMVTNVDASWSLGELQSFLAGSAHSRFPVVDGSPDRIVGVLHSKSLLRLDPLRPWTEAIVEPPFIPEDKPLSDLLQVLRSTGQHLAIVLDEFGGFSGVVTLEDALELVVGEIQDEFDQELEAEIVAVGRAWSVPGYLSLRRLERLLHHSVRPLEGVDSVGGLVASIAGVDPPPGTEVEWDGVRLKVLEVDAGRATRLEVRARPEDRA
jgi:CBS domain containing-hemolysin-like protein